MRCYRPSKCRSILSLYICRWNTTFTAVMAASNCIPCIWEKFISNNRARKSRTTLQNKVRLKVLPEQFTLFVNTFVTLKKCIIQ